MADGDITSIKELGRYTIPGSGHNLNGVAKNNKVMAWGTLVGTYAAAGMDLRTKGGVQALGVSVADYIGLTVRYAGATATTVPADQTLFLANLDESDKIFVCDQVGTANPAVVTPGEAVTIDYFVFGEDTSHPELT